MSLSSVKALVPSLRLICLPGANFFFFFLLFETGFLCVVLAVLELNPVDHTGLKLRFA